MEMEGLKGWHPGVLQSVLGSTLLQFQIDQLEQLEQIRGAEYDPSS
jgi:hypothetical protein